MRVRVRTTLENQAGESFMGRGLAALLHEIEAVHSIQQAARELGMSYVKALKILNRLEDNAGYAVVVRHRGGHEHGGAELTEAGRRLLLAFERLSRRVEHQAEKAGADFFKSVKPNGERT